ncbi:MAG: FHA domain-containing protein [Deltaproteobacteria bacterium]|nr:FHA domain-containing protein [Deltaproteobacteria bacterium]
MAIDHQLLEVLACIQCKGPLVVVEGGRGVLCEHCQLKFPVRDDVPLLILEEGLDLKARPTGGAAASAARVDSGKAAAGASFRVVAGTKKGAHFSLELGTCRAIGRAVSDPHKTASFHVDVTLALDENTRKVIHQYVTKQFRRAEAAPGTEFGFRRTGDIVLEDVSVSRLHAMLFFDDIGVGVLDLVSKNGTYVNGEEVESRLLQPGDAIEVGETKMVLEG